MKSKQRASAFSNSVVVAKLVAFSEQVEAEGCGNKEPQPLVVLSLSRGWLLYLRRLRFSELLQRTSAFSNPVFVANCVAFSEQVEAEESRNEEPQPLGALSLSRPALPFQSRLRLRKVVTENLSLKHAFLAYW